MRNLLSKIVGAFAAGLFFVGVVATTVVPALAVTIPPTYAPRLFLSQQKHYLRFVFNFNSCVLASNACSVKVGAIPVNSFLTDVWIKPTTAFNSAGNDTLSLGITSATGTEILSGSTNNIQGSTLVHFCGTSCGSGTFAGIGLAVTNATSTGADGGFDVYAHYVQTSTAPTAGVAVVILEYVAPNDGACIDYPIVATSPAVC
jgi:hypothetical protein